MVELLCAALVAVDYLSCVVPRGQRTMKFIVDGVYLVGEACPHVLNCILTRKTIINFKSKKLRIGD
jgi:hypothetical protein